LDAGVDDFIAKDDFIGENLMSTVRVYLDIPDDENAPDHENMADNPDDEDSI
jgi:hypothetical protein